jgi:hypothetical protein
MEWKRDNDMKLETKSPGEKVNISEGMPSRVGTFDDQQNSSHFSGTERGNISDSSQPTGALILPLNRRSNRVT